ncbi:MAG: hypothetical protein QF406_12225 [Verrucomicrobiota bacterium]|jgi:hypothetical protein|nr:hypothetical protein [Verrucomicrobiota bacterium]
MKLIDIKSLLIGVLLASTIFLGVAATSPADKWNEKQRWAVGKLVWGKINARNSKWMLTEDSKTLAHSDKWPEGWEPISHDGKHWRVRKRIK